MTLRLGIGVVALVGAFLPGRAQPFPLNQQGRITFMEVVTVDSTSRDELFSRACNWMQAYATKGSQCVTRMEKDSLQHAVTGEFQTQVYTQHGLLKKLEGAVTYSLTLETKENRYRYVVTDFTYHYYKQNRNYQMVKTGKTLALETKYVKGWQKSWDHHRRYMFAVIQEQLTIINDRMKRLVLPDPPPVVATATESEW